MDNRGHLPSGHRHRPFSRANNNASSKQHRGRRRPLLSFRGQRGLGSRRRSRASLDRRAPRGRDGPPDAERMRRLEDSLAGRMSEFAGRQGGDADSGNGSSDLEEGEARATDYLDNLLHPLHDHMHA